MSQNGLPQFWEAAVDLNGRLYFVNQKTQEKTWDDPRPLGKGWRTARTQAGKLYYINDM